VSTDRIGATLQHCLMIQQKIATLQGTLASAREQLFHDVAITYRAGGMTLDELADLYDKARRAGSGFSAQWEAVVPVTGRTLLARQQHLVRRQMNGPGGVSWVGVYPLPVSAPAPPNWTSVVYVLYDSTNEPVYVGSSEHFRERLIRHAKYNGVPVVSWMACPTASREAAYLLEDTLLKERLPSMNRKASR
jgi:hypothetical protein